MSTLHTVQRAAGIAADALNTIDDNQLASVSKAAILAEEYAHFRSCGISRPLTLEHLVRIYRTTPAYAARICKENLS